MQDGLFFLFGLDQTQVDVDLQGPCNTRIATLAAQSQLTVDRALQALCPARLLGVLLDLQHPRIIDQHLAQTLDATQWKPAAVRLSLRQRRRSAHDLRKRHLTPAYRKDVVLDKTRS